MKECITYIDTPAKLSQDGLAQVLTTGTLCVTAIILVILIIWSIKR